jgi:hypothetical protein
VAERRNKYERLRSRRERRQRWEGSRRGLRAEYIFLADGRGPKKGTKSEANVKPGLTGRHQKQLSAQKKSYRACFIDKIEALMYKPDTECQKIHENVHVLQKER